MVGTYAYGNDDEYNESDIVDERIEQLRRAIREQQFVLSVLEDQQAEDEERIQDLKDRIRNVSHQLKSHNSGQDERLWARYELNVRRLQDLADEGRALKKELDYLMDVSVRDLEKELLEETKRLNDINMNWAKNQNISTGQVTLDDPGYTEADRIRARAQALVASRINANRDLRNFVQTEEERARQRSESVETLISELRNLHANARDIIRFSIPEADGYLDTSTDHMRQRQMFEKGLYVSEELARFMDSLDRDTRIVAPEPVRYPTLLTPEYEYSPSVPPSPPPVPTTQRPKSPRSAVDIKAEAQRRIEQRRQLFMKSQPPSQQPLQQPASSRPSSVKSDSHEEKAAQERMRRAEAEARERLQAMHDQRLKARQEAEEKRRRAAEEKQKELERIRLQKEQEKREAEEARLKQEEERRRKEREEQERRERELALKQKQEEELRQQRIRMAAEQAAREKRLRQEEIEKLEQERQAAALEAEKRRRAWLEAEEEKKRQREQEAARIRAEEEQRRLREQEQKEEEERRRMLQEEEEQQQNQSQVKETAGTSGYGVDIEDEVDFSTIYRVKTLYEYHGVRDDDLTFGEDEIIKAHPHKDSESDWWYGTSLTTNQVGFFPRTYVEIIEEAFRVRALYDFNKTREDDLAFVENDIIVIQPFQDEESDWWYGTSEESNESGYFPKTYVERIDDTPAPAPSSSSPPPNCIQHSENYLSVEPPRGMSAPNTPVMKKEELTVNKTETTRRRRAASNVGMAGDMPVGRARTISLSESSRPVSPSLVTWASTMDENELAAIPAEERKRQEAIYELITTEKTYLRDLQLIVNVFYADSSKYLTRDEQDIVFSNIDDLLLCNTALLSDLENRQRDGAGVVGSIGDIFLKHTESLKCYSTYCRNQSFASRFLQDKRDTDQWFNVFLKTAQARPECRALDLSHFLLEPMQRITRYPLLLRKILDATPKRHPDYGVLRSALLKAEKVLQDVNDETRRYENSQKIKKLSRILDVEGHGRLDAYGREFVMDGVLYKAKSGRKLHGYLFNDVLILAEPLKGLSAEGYLYRLYREPMNIDRVTIRQQANVSLFSSSGNHSDDLAFQIVYGNQVIAVKAPSASQKKQWISQMQHYSALQRQLSPTRNSFY